MRDVFGHMPDGTPVERVVLDDGRGLVAAVIGLGASVQSVRLRGAEVALGHDALAPYLARRDYLGATVGRVANRIAGGRFVLDGREYRVPANNGPNALHGGPDGFDRRAWRLAGAGGSHATFALESPDGDNGFPGAVRVTATYEIAPGELRCTYRATADRPTAVALSNHAYWNLAGGGTAMEHELTLPAENFLPVDDGQVPTGDLRPVQGSAFDFREPRRIGERVRGDDPQLLIGRGYDHNWVLDASGAPLPEPRLAARLRDPASGRALEVWSDQPGIQFYSGNFFDGAAVGRGWAWRQGDAVALEPQLFPDVVNRAAFGSARLEPGREYLNRIIWRLRA